ncbi:hypothetical protein V8F33_008321 [Rhypophila sp. PSN 637]
MSLEQPAPPPPLERNASSVIANPDRPRPKSQDAPRRVEYEEVENLKPDESNTRPRSAPHHQDDQPHNEGPDNAALRRSRTTELKEKFTAQKQKLTAKTKPAGGYDSTPLPDAPQGYTVKFIFHKATNLPVADMHTHSADPFILATLTADVPRRHKEEPLLTHRTPTARRTTEPVWENEWVVANVPASGFTLKCRLYDEDWPDHDDRLGNVTIHIPHLDENWEGLGPDGQIFEVRKRSGSKRAYLFKAISNVLTKGSSITPLLHLGMEVVGKSDPPHAQMYTVGPTCYVKHFSPMIGRLTGIKVNKDESADVNPHKDDHGFQKYEYVCSDTSFQANELQLAGPVPEKLYHRFVEFRPIIGLMFKSHGVRGHILNKMLHKQHKRIYNYDSSTEYGSFKACSEEAALQFLKMAHFDEGGRVFTYVLTLDGLMRFTETGQEFGIDLLSKHSMHSDVATYIACSGEFFIRRLERADGSDELDPPEATHPSQDLSGGPPNDSPPRNPKNYQLIIDNDSGTYRPDKSTLPELKKFLEKNFPGLGIVTMDWENKHLQELKKKQRGIKKKEGGGIRMVLNRSPSNSSFSSDDESRLSDLVRSPDDEDAAPVRTKKERAFDVLGDPRLLKEYLPRRHDDKGEDVAVEGGDSAVAGLGGGAPEADGQAEKGKGKGKAVGDAPVAAS